VQALRDGVTERISGAGGRVDYVEVDALCLRGLHLCCCVESLLALMLCAPAALVPGMLCNSVAGMQGAGGALQRTTLCSVHVHARAASRVRPSKCYEDQPDIFNMPVKSQRNMNLLYLLE